MLFPHGPTSRLDVDVPTELNFFLVLEAVPSLLQSKNIPIQIFDSAIEHEYQQFGTDFGQAIYKIGTVRRKEYTEASSLKTHREN